MLLPDQTYEQAYPPHNIPLHKNIIAAKQQSNGSTPPTSKSNIPNKLNITSESESDSDSESESDQFHDDHRKNFDKTTEFFNNIPEYSGEPLGPFSIPLINTNNDIKTSIKTSIKTNQDDILRECESFLWKYRIRPEFFCRYRQVKE